MGIILFANLLQAGASASGSAAAASNTFGAVPSSLLVYCQLIFLILFGLLGLICALLLIHQLRREEPPEVRIYWGGFGNAGTGWRVSPAFTYLVLSVFFTLICAAVGIFDIRSPARPQDQHAPPGSTGAPPVSHP